MGNVKCTLAQQPGAKNENWGHRGHSSLHALDAPGWGAQPVLGADIDIERSAHPAVAAADASTQPLRPSSPAGHKLLAGEQSLQLIRSLL